MTELYAGLSWPKRFTMGSSAILGTLLYATSFYYAYGIDSIAPIAKAVGFASGISWVCFGLILLKITQSKPSLWFWADTCLQAMTRGMWFLYGSALINGLLVITRQPLPLKHPEWLLAHFSLLFLSDLTMGYFFTQQTKKANLNPGIAILLWVLGLNGIFTLLLFIQLKPGFPL